MTPPDVTIYGSNCPACTQAKALLDRFAIPYQERPMSEFPRRDGRVTTMPQITIDHHLVGGINRLLKLARSGGLKRLAQNDSDPWVEIKRRIGRGYDVELAAQLPVVPPRVAS